MDDRFKLLIFLISSFSLYGFEWSSRHSHTSIAKRFRHNLLENEGVHKLHIPGVKNTIRPFKSLSQFKDKRGQRRVIRMIQTYKGIKVFGSRIVELYWGNCRGCKVATIGRKAALYEMSTLPYVPREQALEIAQQESQRNFSKATLMIYPTSSENHLAWVVDEDSEMSRLKVFVDAHNGAIINSYDNISCIHEVAVNGIGVLDNEQSFTATSNGNIFEMVSLNPVVKTYEHNPYNGRPVLVTSETPFFENASAAAIDAQSYSQKFVKFLQQRFNRRGYDDRGTPVMSTVNVRRRVGVPNRTACWSGSRAIYGIGDEGKVLPLSGALDIVAHEITHGITQTTSNLIYKNESGALNEAFSDIMGTYVEHQLDPKNADWKLGEDVYLDGSKVRYMNDPARDGLSRDHYSNRYRRSHDNGGVHRNSGIANLAFYLLAQGGVHPRRTSHQVQGIGLERAMDIFYKAFTELLAKNSKFIDARNATVLMAREYDGQTVLSVMQAWAAVGVGGIEEGHHQGKKSSPQSPHGRTITSNIEMAIPDKDREGIEDVLYVDTGVRTLTVSVDIEHTYRGDLIVKLISPELESYTLHRRNGGRDDHLKKIYKIDLRFSDHSAGDWLLHVSDHAKRDEGILKKWSISW